MKTRIIPMTLILLFTIATIAGASNIKIKNSFTASCIEKVQEQDGQELVGEITLQESSMLNDWIATREIWEQESQEMVNDITLQESSMLNDWIATRELWEQDGQKMVSYNTPDELSMLNNWIANRENWEQD